MIFRMKLALAIFFLSAICLAQQSSHFRRGNVGYQPNLSNFNSIILPRPVDKSQTDSYYSTLPGDSSRPLRAPPLSDQGVITIVPCKCPFTPEYNPICASDNQSYGNMAILNCYRQCGYNIKFSRGGTCSQVAGRGI